MKEIVQKGVWKILKLFYDNGNKDIHLRDISRRAGMNESSISRHLNKMVREKIMVVVKDGNLKKFRINNSVVSMIFPLFDYEKLENLPLLRKNAVKLLINKIEPKPLFMVVFGSTAKGNFNDKSDLDLLVVGSKKIGIDVIKYVEAQTGVNIQEFFVDEKEFKEELSLKKDMVIQSAIKTGFPVFNQKYYYELIYNG